MSAQTKPWLSPEQYLELERSAEFRHEYYNGRMFAMSGGTFNHALIIGALVRELGNGVKGKLCDVLPNDMRVRVAPDGLYTYPDIVAVCGKPEFGDKRTDTLLNPTLILEVLSPSTEAYDRGFKATQYRKLPSLNEYAFVSQTEARVELFRRQPSGDWLFSESSGRESSCHFTSVDCSVSLAEVYKRVVFEGDDFTNGRSDVKI